ncbi:MAG: nuclear transport factor 2 family protein [Terricaulis sp.]
MFGRMLAAALALLVAPVAARAQEPAPSEVEQIARAYMQAYSEANWNGMAPYMGDDYVLVDRTNPDPDFQPEHRGRDAALQMMRAFGRDQGVIQLGFEFPTVFESNDIVVFSGFVNVYAAPPGVEYAYRWRTEQVTVLTIRDRHVVRHEDYANYEGATASRLPRP